MGKGQVKNERRNNGSVRNLILVIGLVVLGVLLLAGVFLYPRIKAALNQPTANPNVAVTPFTPLGINAPVDGRHVGNASAPVQVDVWEDFQCEACKTYSQTVEPKLIENYVNTNKVYYTYHFYPFEDDGTASGESHQAANAALCAGDQGQFWSYHDLLIANLAGVNKGSFSTAHLEAFAGYLHLDTTTFDQCVQLDTYQNLINQDLLAGQTAGVHTNGIPSVFVNGQLLTPGFVPTYDQVVTAINTILAGQ